MAASNRSRSARLLLERAAEHDSLSAVQREACRNPADDLDTERAEPSPVRAAHRLGHHAPAEPGRRIVLCPEFEKDIRMNTLSSLDTTSPQAPRNAWHAVSAQNRLRIRETAHKLGVPPKRSWLVRKPTTNGGATSIELFDTRGEFIACFFGKHNPGIPETIGWRMLAESMETR